MRRSMTSLRPRMSVAVAEAHADRERSIQPVPLESVIAEFDGDL